MLLSLIFGNNILEFPDSILFCQSIFLCFFRAYNSPISHLNTCLMISDLKFVFARLHARLIYKYLFDFNFSVCF
ncbi:uncharacterized protein F4817DRAFT_338808 [Daldinia loculata]|uniref:uncharacterized protein n=1 Tax=Daldinia loculata TaxID=103429 RepID=UPI0020C456D2|nr:uncharacterized protein F4817DRAFT_338808 [Daldinia loculata]KAI1646909.1 hypothetical protein F4817DRAFT_338808 [Daldinia loculata]